MIRALPAYDLGPGKEGDELLLNVILYGMVAALLLSMAWVVIVPLVQTVRDRRRNRYGESGSSRAAATDG